MRSLKYIVSIVSIMLMFSCENEQKTNKEEVNDRNKSILTAEEIITNSYDFHGVDKLLKSDVKFNFRKHEYSIELGEGGIVRTRITIDSNNREIKDVWIENNIQRFIDDSLQVLEKKMENAYRNSINSVFYFAFLPKGLTDPAVNLELLNDVKINSKDYYKVRVTFDEEGGGEDHHDIFIYWFDKEDFSMDYLAYEYFTEGGGIRFREAINAREVAGIVFQDYINYKPENENTKLENTDSALEKGNLKEVSRIELENVIVE